MDNKVHVLSKNGLFLFRFNDSEFGSKWCGIWKKSKKYFDYFAFRFDGEGASSVNIKKFEYYNSQSAYLEFQLKNGVVKESVSCFDDRVLVTISSDFETNLEMEPGINIRKRNDNYSPAKRYQLKAERGHIEAEFGSDKAYIFFDRGEFEKNEYYGLHSPGKYAIEKGFTKYLDDGAVQNKYVPGVIKAGLKPGESINFIFSVEDIDQETIYKTIKNRDTYTKGYSELLDLIAESIGEVGVIKKEFIRSVVDALYSYSNFNDAEVYAGFPYFNEFWARDALLVLPSFLSLNNFQFVKSVLLNISKSISKSGIPAIIGEDYFPTDAPALFIICLYEYIISTGDSKILDEIKDKLTMLLDLGKDKILDGLVRDAGRSTWMDSREREFSVEIQALWAEAFRRAAGLTKLLGSEDSELIKTSLLIKENLNRYKRDGYYSDQAKKDINSANQVFLPFYNAVDTEEDVFIVTNLSTNLLNSHGLQSVSQKDPSFDPKGYHNGAIWPFLTAMLAGSAYKIGDYGLGDRCIQVLEKDNFDLQCSSRINEIIQPDGAPKGCPSQLWSIGLIPFIIDRFLLGIKVNAIKGEIEIRKPADDLKATRRLALGGKQVKIVIGDGKVSSNQKVSEDAGKYVIRLS
jgi:predicted glycogen debranching enzyme